MSAKYSEMKKYASPGSYIFTGIKKTENLHVTLISYNKKEHEVLEFDSADNLIRHLKDDRVNWINISGLHDVKKIEHIGNSLNLHPLVLEDVLNTDHSPKYENYIDYAFLIAKMIDLDQDRNLNIEQISFVLKTNVLISFQEDSKDVFNVIRERLKNNIGRIRSNGADYLLYRLLDTMVDNYYSIIEHLEGRFDVLDSILLPGKQGQSLQPVYIFRKDLMRIRRAVFPLQETIIAFEKERENLISKNTYLFLRDLIDHIKYIHTSIENYHEMVNSMIEVYMSSESHRLNEVIKVLTIISTIFIPLTFIVGIYGMNFNTKVSPWNMPELNWAFGYPAVMIFMFLISAGLLIFFKRKKWF